MDSVRNARHLRRLLALALLAGLLVIGTVAAPAAANAAVAPSKHGISHPKSFLVAGNGILSVAIDDASGQFYVATGANHPQPNQTVLYPGATSYLSLRDASSQEMWANWDPLEFSVGDAGLANYVLKNATQAPAGVVVTALGSTGFRSTFNLPNWQIVQDVVINGTTLADTNVLHKVTVTNTSAAPRQYGLRYLWDWQIAGQDGSAFRPRNPDGTFTNTFATFTNPNFQRYEEVDNPASPTFSVFGTVSSGALSPVPTQPEQVRYASWPTSFPLAWDFNNTGSGGDSSVAYYWGFNSPLTLGAGASATFAQYITTQLSAVAVNPPTVVVSVSPARLIASGVATISWTAQNSNGCAVSGGAAGSGFNISQTPGSGTATTNVQVGASARNDTFVVTCTGSGGTTVTSTVLAVGVAAPPPPQPVVKVSTGIGGQAANGPSTRIALSDGARFVAFESSASNLVNGDSNGSSDVFVRNAATGAIQRASVDSNGAQLNAVNGEAAISRDGRFVAFTSGTGTSAGLASEKSITGGQICIRDLNGNVLACISKSPGNVPGNGASSRSAISGDGTVTVYQSTATNLLSTPDGNGAVSDVFAYDSKTQTTTVLSKTVAGQFSPQPSSGPTVSCGGTNFAFETLGVLTETLTQNGIKNIVVISPFAGGKKLVSVGLNGAPANGDSRNPTISDDGRFVAFESDATNMVANDSNGVTDIFVADLYLNTMRRVSVAPNGSQGNGASRNPKMSCDGASLSFSSDASNLVSDDGNGLTDTFVASLGTGTIAMESRTTAGGSANGSSGNGSISPDGTSVGFDSTAPNLGGTTTSNVFTGTNPFTAQNFTGTWYDRNQSGHGLFLNQLADGNLVAIWYTFDPAGNQAWFVGEGAVQGNTAIVPVVRPQGTTFLNFRSSDVQRVPIGTLTFTFTSCASGRVDFALDSVFGNGSMTLQRLTAPVGVNCPAYGAPKSESIQGPIAGLTGAWLDLNTPGQGLFLENEGNGTLVASWFSFGTTSGQAWFLGAGPITDGNHAHIEFVKTQGGRWIPNFNPANVTNPDFGPIDLTFTSCLAANGGQVHYVFAQGFGTGTLMLTNAADRPIGTICSG